MRQGEEPLGRVRSELLGFPFRMATHFDTLGFRPTPDAGTQDLVTRLPALSHWEPNRAVWSDGSGASITFHLGAHGQIECVTPFFTPPSALTRWKVRTHAASVDASCTFCGGADCDILDVSGEMATRAAVQWLQLPPFKDWLGAERIFELDVVGFAQKAAFFDSAADFEKAQEKHWQSPDGTQRTDKDGKPIRFADEAFIPSGMFGPPTAPMSARAVSILIGPVERFNRLENTFTHQEFWCVRLRCGPVGALDVLVDPSSSEGQPTLGRTAWVHAYVVGQPTTPPPDFRPWWKRVLRLR